MATIVTATPIIPAIKTAIRTHATLGFSEQELPTIVGGHSGTFDVENLPKPAVVIAALTEDNPRPPVTRSGEKFVQIVVHGYTSFFGQEIGILGDAHTLGLYPLMDRLELILDANLLSGLVIRAHALGKRYPEPFDMNYPGLNEGRLPVEYFSIDPQHV